MTTPYYQDERVTVHAGDCLDVLPTLPDASVDAVVTDPPYGLEFMGKEWDSFKGDTWRNSAGLTGTGYTDGGKRLVRPSYGGGDSANATCLICGGRMRGAKKCECSEPEWRVKGKPLDARDNNAGQMRAFQSWCEFWSAECLRVLKPGGHMLAFGGTRTSHRLACAIEDAGFEIRDSFAWLYGSGFPKSLDVSKAIDQAACPDCGWVTGHTLCCELKDEDWRGWGTALKPAHEPIVVARKPLVGTVAANVLEYGTGALNIDGCRIEGEPTPSFERFVGQRPRDEYRTGTGARTGGQETAGRWPANVVLDESQAEALDQMSGTLTSGAGIKAPPGKTHGFADGRLSLRNDGDKAYMGDSGGASRFFYIAKADSAERPRVNGIAHPTVKPLALMRWLVRLVTPPGGIVLEPFAGSGTTVEACVLEGLRCIAIEREADYLPLITSRLTQGVFDFGEVS